MPISFMGFAAGAMTVLALVGTTSGEWYPFIGGFVFALSVVAFLGLAAFETVYREGQD